MDVANSQDIIDINSIKTWQKSINISYGTLNKAEKEVVFDFSTNINSKIGLWSGNIYKLKCDAIVIPINNFVDGKITIESSLIYKSAGSKYARSFVNTVLGCKTSEIRVTDGYGLPCNYVFHTVCPRFNPKYESAAVNAIYNCYRNSLLTAMDKNVRKIVFSSLHLSKYPFPDDLAIHITARTIRRFLEKYSDYIDVVILQIPEILSSLYEQILPIYFPRNSEEENYSAANTPDDLGNEDGQPFLPDREIRISAFPYGPKTRPSNSDESTDDELETRKYSDITSSNRRALAKIHVAPAILRESLNMKYQGQLAETLKSYEENLTLERRFDRLLRCSKKMDISDLTDLRVFYQCGKDIQDQPILIVVEKNIPLNIDNRRNEILAFIIATLEKTVKGKNFSIIYAHTQSNFHPTRDFLTEVYHVLRFRYSKLLNFMCMVHPNLYSRGLNWIFTTFNAPDLKSKMFNVTNLRQLYRILNPSLLDLPDFIYEYDKQVGGNNRFNDLISQGNTDGGVTLLQKPSPTSNFNAEL